MNCKFLITATIVSFSAVAYGQTIPIGFKNPKTQLFKDVPATTFTEQSIDDDGKKTTKTITVNTTYQAIADDLRKTSKGIEESAQEDFADGIKKLKSPKTSADFRTYEAGLQNLEEKRSQDLKDVKFFEKKAKAFEYLQRISETWSWRPVRNAVDAEMYYNGTIKDSKAKFLSNSLLSFSSDGGKASLYNELYADYFGAIRFGFGALISNKQQITDSVTVQNAEGKKEDAVQRLLGGGGNGVINLSYPLLNVDNGNGFAMKLGLAPKLGLDIPKIGTEKNDYAVNYNLGAEGTIYYSGANDIITIYSTFRFAGIGGNGVFYNNLDKTDKKVFGFHQVSVGLGITSSFRLSYNHYFF
jgi:hypothetical protein